MLHDRGDDEIIDFGYDSGGFKDDDDGDGLGNFSDWRRMVGLQNILIYL